jgi:ligand-binding sensor domain-containing protein
VYRSTDNGANWTAVNYGLLNPDVSTLAVLGTTLFAGTHGGVFLSKDWGNSWTRLDPGPGSIVNCFHIGGTDIFAGAHDGVYFSTNNGNRWISANAGLINTVISVFVRDGTNLFAGTTHSGLFLSIDDGSNWVKTSLTAAYVSSLVVSPNGAGGTNLFAGTSLGVSRSTDGGTHWTI